MRPTQVSLVRLSSELRRGRREYRPRHFYWQAGPDSSSVPALHAPDTAPRTAGDQVKGRPGQSQNDHPGRKTGNAAIEPRSRDQPDEQDTPYGQCRVARTQRRTARCGDRLMTAGSASHVHPPPTLVMFICRYLPPPRNLGQPWKTAVVLRMPEGVPPRGIGLEQARRVDCSRSPVHRRCLGFVGKTSGPLACAGEIGYETASRRGRIVPRDRRKEFP